MKIGDKHQTNEKIENKRQNVEHMRHTKMDG